jgi:hypothetical protein
MLSELRVALDLWMSLAEILSRRHQKSTGARGWVADDVAGFGRR